MDADVLVEIGFALGAFAAVLTGEERFGDGVPFDVGVERVAGRKGGVAQVTLQVADAAVRFHVVLQRRFRLHLKKIKKNNVVYCTTARWRTCIDI